MSLGQLLLVAFVQGFTEYLPVSSSAHLVLLPKLLDTADQGLSLDVAAHTGTFLAAAVYFREDIRRLWRGLVSRQAQSARSVAAARHLGRLLLVGSVPVLVVGWLFRDQIATVARRPTIIAVTSIVFGIVLMIADRVGRRTSEAESLSLRDGLKIGLVQVLALIPGTSRSGITISAALLLNLRRDEAARFSFLLSLPVSIAVAASEFMVLRGQSLSFWLRWEYLLVMGVSALVGHTCIRLFIGFVRKRGLTVFAVYRLVMGLVILAVVVVQKY